MEGRKMAVFFFVCFMALMAFANVGVKAAVFEDVGAPTPTPGASNSAMALGVPAVMAAVVSMAAVFF
ncbi:hypothetical protein CDL12_07036 [Handroanthus impetiginosus]|uniref:Transmembrane protein n=1 Tax=Handroanthus impetiginosus TaxID=429701 RepID=A0A2G9HS49_9LAMI|nr:hypothetical protein CDL12_07036 [Handroanthus impetiginosus]